MTAPDHPSYDTALAILAEWGERSEQAYNPEDPTTQLAVIASRMISLGTLFLCAHPPIWQDGGWVCMSCVDVDFATVSSRAVWPCHVAANILESVLRTGPVPPPMGIQMIIQRDPEQYIEAAAEDLSDLHGTAPVEAKEMATTVLGAIARILRLPRAR